jgi:4-diphosphocytidyl-2-C-methyl-D-erythritol kinase
MVVTEFAPAKINLYLHVVGKQPDGYHQLDSLVVFAAKGSAACDQIEVVEAPSYTLRIDGLEAAGIQHEDPEKNLVTKALRAFSSKVGKPLHFSVKLHKQLPIASGIGGGSADAAAALRAVGQFWHLTKTHPPMMEAAAETGADVPACLQGETCYFEGTGHTIEPGPHLPKFWLVLVNPHIPVPTAEVFRARQGAYSQRAKLGHAPNSVEELVGMLSHRSNDLQEAASGLVDAIQNALDLLASQNGCLLSRMSGSGGTCFGLFTDEISAQAASDHIRRQIREYWVAVTAVG